ncbi:exodeoxyribonuclease III [Isoptericola sp. b490]|uniref:exodeoxyribonuclease III n=1 Tax=Actinotalea lenta TaxID=3064654 RepID=UPI0027135AC5|nr:exodeoxyribonuclease III [Isoptericola sp. b490]MDO8122720.1 exodeoxyribonuclease III [Isoptericola sp. b490]
MRIASVNVNGVRAAFRRGMAQWLESCAPDVLLLQEVRAPAEVVSEHLPGWHVVHAEAAAKGRAGVAVASRLPISAVRVGLAEERATHTGRWLEADLERSDAAPLTVVSVYVHSGTVGHPSMDDKHEFLSHATRRMAELQAAGPAVIGGDLNITHTDADLKNWKGNVGKAGCLPDERAWLTRWFDAGWVDVARRHAGDVSGPYTWWSWRGKAFDNDAGWRIDYQVATADVAATVRDVRVERAPAYDTRFSDHAPLVVDYE